MQKLPVLLFGIGGVGRALLHQIIEQRTFHAQQYGLIVDIVAVCDSSGAVTHAHGLEDELLSDLITAKEAGNRLIDHPKGQLISEPVEVVEKLAQAGSVVVDCTASDATIPALLLALEKNCKLTLANKKPFTTEQEVYDRLTRAGLTPDAGTGLGTINLSTTRWETTVGAGLPIIATLNRRYVMTGLQEGRLLSEIVREAHRLGYTEPDPRDDLGGTDVARKALILARGLGWQLDMADVEVTGLYPPHMDQLSVDAFLDELAQEDAQFQAQVQDAITQNKVLRYAATVEGGSCRVGPIMVDADSPLGRLTGTDNLAEFQTRWYSPNPLVIQGRGAGMEATAAGVLSDIIELSFSG